MKSYLQLLKTVLDKGTYKAPAREGMPSTLDLFHYHLEHDMADGLPLLTTKHISFKNVLVELLWFVKGDTNIKYLIDNGCNIWNGDALKFFKRKTEFFFGDQNPWANITMEEFLTQVKGLRRIPEVDYTFGDLGNVYGAQWTRWGKQPGEKPFNQLRGLVNGLIENPNSRYHIVTAWNPRDFLSTPNIAALPACHVYFQCNVTNRVLDLSIVQRSCDSFLGVPYNLASYGTLLLMLCHLTGYKPGKLHWTGMSVHIYENHLDQVKEILTRTPGKLPTLEIDTSLDVVDLADFEMENFRLVDYQPQSTISAPLSVGV